MADRYPESARLLARARTLTTGGAQTLSRQAEMWGVGGAPVFQDRAKGARLWDADGREYVDLLLGLGAVALGHAYDPVDEAAFAAARRGICPSLSTRLEADLAEQLRAIIPCAEQSRFIKSGTEACMAAMRVARWATGRETLIFSGYHGWGAEYAGSKPRHEGVPTIMETLAVQVPYNDLPALDGLFAAFRRIRRPVAAVMMEAALYQQPSEGYLEEVRRLCSREGALLIFDEVVTGFRWALGGAQEFFGIVPDLAIFGKAMGNGWPLAALVGRADLMRHAEFCSSTFGAETASLAAALETVRTYREGPVIKHLWTVGGDFQEGAARLAEGTPFVCDGYPCKPRLRCTEADPERNRLLTSFLLQHAAVRGVLLHVSGQNVSLSHGLEDLKWALEGLRWTFLAMREALADGRIRERLVGQPYEESYRRLSEEGHGGPRI